MRTQSAMPVYTRSDPAAPEICIRRRTWGGLGGVGVRVWVRVRVRVGVGVGVRVRVRIRVRVRVKGER